MALILTATAAARYLGVSRPTLRKWTLAGIVPHQVITDPDTRKSRVVYHRHALRDWSLNNGRTAA